MEASTPGSLLRMRVIGWKLCLLIFFSAMAIETIVILVSGVRLYRLYSVRVMDEWVANQTNLEARVAKVTKQPPKPKEPSPDDFLDAFKTWCENKPVPTVAASTGNGSIDACPCISPHLEGPINVTFEMPPFGELELQHTELGYGGHWRPTECLPRHKVVIIVPFRDREEHLRIFLNVVHPMLQRQQLDYRIVVIEQAGPDIFNKAMMMNIGFKESMQLFKPDCFIFHDVDMIPEDDRNMYVCSDQPRHVGSHCDKFNYTVPYKGIFGGATAFKPDQFEFVNGFSNQFYGWGGEDDDMYKRVLSKRLKVVRYPGSVSRYKMIKHKTDKRNPYNKNSNVAWNYRPRQYSTDGLNTLNYARKAIEHRPLYTWIYAEVPKPQNFNKPLKRKGRYSNSSEQLEPPKISLLILSVVNLLCML